MKIIDADKLHYKQVYIQTEKGLRPALVVFAKEIRKMPEIPWLKAQVDPIKHGHWIDMADFEQCSVCHATRLKELQTYYGKAIWLKTPYCSYCGSKIDEVEDGKTD